MTTDALLNGLLVVGFLGDAALVGYLLRAPVRRWRLRRHNRKYVRAMQASIPPLALSRRYSQHSLQRVIAGAVRDPDPLRRGEWTLTPVSTGTN